jgi:hypothetical protein
MQAIARLLEDDAPLSFEHVARYFFAAMGGQAVHYAGVFGGSSKKCGV